VAMMLFLVPSRSKLVGDGLPKLKGSLIEAAKKIVAAARIEKQRTSAMNQSAEDNAAKASREAAENGSDRRPLENIPIATKYEPSHPRPLSGEEDKEALATTPGKLALTSRPWAMVTIDNISYGQTPLTGPIELPPGDHVVTLNNPEFPSPFTETVRVPSGGSVTLDANLWDIVGVIQVLSVKPWAEIFVDGVSYGSTPMAKPIIVTFGKHIIELQNPDFKTWREEIEFQPGSKALELSVQLAVLPKK